MDASDLKVFEAVARLGGMGRAAAELNTVQSNVTARIRRLEDELGATLFERHSRGVTPTSAGRRLLPYASMVEAVLADARRATLDDGDLAGALTIGSLETTAALRLSPILTSFVSTHPAVDLALRTGTTCELIEDVLARRIEGAFVCGPVVHGELEAETVFREELALLTAPGVDGIQALSAETGVKIVVLREGCSYRQRLEDILARRGVVGLRRLEFGTLEAIIGCVAAGIGVTLLPRGLIGPVWRDGRVAVHPLAPRDALVDTVFVRRRDGYVSSALRAFLDHARPALTRVDAA
ncbi:MAG: LysR family transcriptional regulator [Alphaproteobacteria bacterium]|nr:LysR family transcriptional regulator [Alphaproteobacteria bacterium]